MLNQTDIKITERDQSVVDLLVNESLSNREIAKQLGISESNVKKRLFRLCLRAGIELHDGHQRVRLAALFRPIREKQLVRVPLTEKEWIIANLVAQGLKNAAIAARLGTTDKVIRNHIRILFDKAGVWSRLELAAWVDAHTESQAHGQ